MASVDDVAAAILSAYAPADPLKLQKLLYYVQAWSLAWRDEPMFEDNIEAWVYGPVIDGIYQRYKRYGYDQIEHAEAGNRQNLSAEEFATLRLGLRRVLEVCWNYNVRSTHSEPPWVEARAGLPDDSRSRRVISQEAIKRHYRTGATFSLANRSDNPSWTLTTHS
jgi:uncharacterized phage-associated protein